MTAIVDISDKEICKETLNKIITTTYDETTYQDFNDQLKFLCFMISERNFRISVKEFFEIIDMIYNIYGGCYTSGYFSNDIKKKFYDILNLFVETVEITAE